jgi:hypothetical protein
MRRFDRRATPETTILALALLGVVWIALVHAFKYRYFLFDDAHITFRHARNLAEGNGLVYNAGERVEGTSTLLFALLLTPPIAFGVDALHAAQVLGCASFVACTLYSYGVVATVLPDRVGRWLGVGAAYAVARATPLAAYSMSGMETDLFVALLLAALCHYLASARSGRTTWAVLLALASATRPEGVGFFALFLLIECVRRVPVASAANRVVGALRAFSIVFVPITLLRVLYYGAILPNPVSAKDTFARRLWDLPWGQAWALVSTSDGVRVLADLADRALLPYAALVVLGLLLRATRFAAVAMLALVAGAIAVCIWDEGDWMPHYRLLVPVLPAAAIGVALGLRVLFEIRAARLASRWLPALLAALVVWAFARRLDYERDAPVKPDYDPAERHLVELGQGLDALRRDDDVLATDIAGIIPYYARMRTVDMFGLCDRHIATKGAHGSKMGKVDYAYVASRRPTFFVLNFMTGVADLYRQPSFAALRDSYWLVRTPYDRNPRVPSRDKKPLLVRKDRPGMEELKRTLHAELVDVTAALGDRRTNR